MHGFDVRHGKNGSATKSGIVKDVIESDVLTAASISVKLTTRDGTDSREKVDIALPKPFNFKNSVISATASASASFITCRIFYNDQQMIESTAKGNAASVTCQGDQWALRK